MTNTPNPGEDRAWELLASLDPHEVCRSSKAEYDPKALTYRLASFGMDFTVLPRNRTITSSSPGNELLLGKLGHFFRLSALWYLVNAKDIPLTGRLVKLQSIRGGDIFSRGSHILPLEVLAGRYGRDRETFLAKGKTFGGVPEQVADTALRMYPLPRIPAVLTLWVEDEEFPARADLLFDSSCEFQSPTDILWSIAMMSVLVML